MDPDVEALVRRGELDAAAALARSRGAWKRAAELLSLMNRPADAVACAAHGGEWRLAMDIALGAGDELILTALAEELGHDALRAPVAASQAKLARRDDVAGMVLEETSPAEAARCWYERANYARAARCFDRAGDSARALRAWEQHLAQTPDDIPAALRLADLRAARGDDAGAVRALQSALRAGAGADAMARIVCGLSRLGWRHGALDWVLRLRTLDATRPAEVDAYHDALPRSDGAERRYAGRYRVVREVGSGATGRVLEAVDELTGDTVALKVLSVGDDRSAAFGRFMREAELARSLEDPQLVRMRALDPEGPTIVYDWMPGGTLGERIGSLALTEVRAITLRVLGALEVLHRHGVVHRDVKPGNILFDPAGQARLGDLGAAHLADLGATVTGGLVGSLPYMAPEQVTGGAVSASTDLYALGCVLFQMLCGRPPFLGPDFVAQHLGEEPPTASSLRPSLDVTFDRLLAALLAKNPDERPQDAREARLMLLALPWAEPSGGAVVARVSSIPPPRGGDETGGRFDPLPGGRWLDRRLGRDVERLSVPGEARALLEAWGRSQATELQALFDAEESDGAWTAWLEPLRGAAAKLSGLAPEGAQRVRRALATVGVEVGEGREWLVFVDSSGPRVALREALEGGVRPGGA
ncbi:MAG: protein kinase [Deltaproteobacteria bacterium]|nr:protein kinase [Deltaproteobacteria bacterium]